MQRMLVIGGGIAGLETALTLRQGLADAQVQLVSSAAASRLRPGLAYVPFGAAPEAFAFDLAAPCRELGIELLVGRASSIDPVARTVLLADGRRLEYDACVYAPGTEPVPCAGYVLRTLADGLRLREAISALRARRRPWDALVIRVLPGSHWAPPAYELALLAGRLLGRGTGQAQAVLVTPEQHPFGQFGWDAAAAFAGLAEQAGVELIAGAPPGRIEEIEGAVTIDIGGFRARPLDGMPHPGPRGFFAVDGSGRLADGLFVVGDAADLPVKSAFATSWQAQRVLRALGGEPPAAVDGIPSGQVRYELDGGGQTLLVEGPAQGLLRRGGIISGFQARLEQRGPDKLRGTLTRELLLGPAYRQRLADQYQLLLAQTGLHRS